VLAGRKTHARVFGGARRGRRTTALFQRPRHQDEQHQQDPKCDRLLLELAHGLLPWQSIQ